MGFYMLFKHSPDQASDTPLGIHVNKETLDALCVFSLLRPTTTWRRSLQTTSSL